MQDDSETLAQAQAAGASAYITKSAPIENLIEVLHSVIKFDSQFIKVGDFQLPKVVKNFDLTQREIEVLSLLPSGKTASAIASLLFLSEATVKTHLASIYRKLGAANRAQAVSIGLAENLITK
jgi:DNA-binding NarL/FixJ family response regulator